MRKHFGSVTLLIALSIWMSSCTGSSEVHTYIHSAYLIDSSTAGIVISNYQGGNGGCLSPDEHPRNFSQKLLIYNFKNFSQQSSTEVGNEMFEVIDVLKEANNLIITKGEGINSGFSIYSLNGGNPRYISLPTLPADCFYASIQTMTPDGNHLLLSTTNNSRHISYYGFLFDLSNNSWSSSFQLSTSTINYLENDCTHYIWSEWVTSKYCRLNRNSLSAGSGETILDISNYKRIYISRSNSLMYTNPDGYAGYFVIDTLATPKARFVSLNVRSPVVDYDTLSGRYLAQTATEVLVGNYKTGEAEKTLYHY